MSNLTREFADVIGEIATELGEGLTATLIQTPSTVDADTGAVTPGTPSSYVFACPPPSPRRVGAIAGGEEIMDALVLVVPQILNASGSVITPTRGDTIELYGADYQIIEAFPLGAGDGIAGHRITLRG